MRGTSTVTIVLGNRHKEKLIYTLFFSRARARAHTHTHTHTHGELMRWLRGKLAAKPSDLSLVPRTHVVEGDNDSDLCMHTVV